LFTTLHFDGQVPLPFLHCALALQAGRDVHSQGAQQHDFLAHSAFAGQFDFAEHSDFAEVHPAKIATIETAAIENMIDFFTVISFCFC
jgi:hypothetical protein